MEKKYLKLIGAAAVILTLLMFAYTLAAALKGDRSGNSQIQGAAAQSSTGNQASPGKAQAGQPLQDETEKLFPSQLAAMNRIELIAGEQALESVSMLHGKDIPMQRAYVANYQGQGNKQMTIWYSETDNLQDARLLFQNMDQKMPNSETFKNYKTVQLDNQEYKFVTGMGQDHYYWLKGSRVLWIAVQGADSLNVLKEVIPLY